MKRFIISMLVIMSFAAPVMAASSELSCSIHPPADTADTNLPGLTKISLSKAKKIALSAIKSPSKKVEDGELEIEQGCLLYSFDIRVSGSSGIEEIMVDAGTGKILSHKHETPKKEADEQAQDKAAISKSK